MRTKTAALLLTAVLLAGGVSGCKKIAGAIACTYNMGLANTSFVATYPGGNTYRGTTDSQGIAHVPNKGNSCNSISVHLGSSFGFFLTANPTPVNLQAAPSSGTVSGPGGMSAAYGMPIVEYYDVNGYFTGSVAATYVSPDGTWLQAPQPDLSGTYSGTYTVHVYNADSGGVYSEEVGSATVTTYGRDRPDSDGDGWYDDEDCYPYDPSRSSCDPPPDPCYGSYGNPAMECGPVS